MPRNKPTFLYAIVSVALVLFLLGFFALVVLHARKLVTLFKEKVDIWLELRPNVAQEEVAQIIGAMKRHPFVKPESVTFITRDQAAASMKEDLGEASLLEDSPEELLRDVVRFNVKAQYLDSDSLLEWRESLRRDSAVADLYYQAADTGNVGENIERLGWLTLSLSLLLILAAVALIHNTIRLALYTNRFIIKNQELVGASWSFISRPYIRRGVLNGIWSGLVAIGMLILLLSWAQHQLPELQQLEDLNGVLAVFTGLLALGALLSGLSTYFVVNKFLHMRVDDLY